jgi:hypothetical protein
VLNPKYATKQERSRVSALILDRAAKPRAWVDQTHDTFDNKGEHPVQAYGPQLRWNGQQLAVVWQDHRRNDPSVYGRNSALYGYYVYVLSTSGAPSVEAQIVQGVKAYAVPALLVDASNLIVAWEKRRTPGFDSIWSASGKLGGWSYERAADPVHEGQGTLHGVQLARDPSGGRAMVWHEQTSDESLFKVAPVDTQGRLAGAPTVLATTERADADQLRVATGDATPIVTWLHSPQAVLTDDRTLRWAPLDGTAPVAELALGDDPVVLLDARVAGETLQVLVARLTSGGTVRRLDLIERCVAATGAAGGGG